MSRGMDPKWCVNCKELSRVEYLGFNGRAGEGEWDCLNKSCTPNEEIPTSGLTEGGIKWPAEWDVSWVELREVIEAKALYWSKDSYYHGRNFYVTIGETIHPANGIRVCKNEVGLFGDGTDGKEYFSSWPIPTRSTQALQPGVYPAKQPSSQQQHTQLSPLAVQHAVGGTCSPLALGHGLGYSAQHSNPRPEARQPRTLGMPTKRSKAQSIELLNEDLKHGRVFVPRGRALAPTKRYYRHCGQVCEYYCLE